MAAAVVVVAKAGECQADREEAKAVFLQSSLWSQFL